MKALLSARGSPEASLLPPPVVAYAAEPPSAKVDDAYSAHSPQDRRLTRLTNEPSVEARTHGCTPPNRYAACLERNRTSRGRGPWHPSFKLPKCCHANRAGVAALTEHQPVELPRLRRVSVGHEMSVTVERRLDRCVAELGLDVLRVRPLSDQETRISVAQVVKPDARSSARRSARCPSPKSSSTQWTTADALATG
jgi:hypothetical protein